MNQVKSVKRQQSTTKRYIFKHVLLQLKPTELRGRLLKSKKTMADAVQKSFDLVAGHEERKAIESSDTGPSGATMSRACMKLDLSHMILRQQQWSQRKADGVKYVVQLGFLSTCMFCLVFFLCCLFLFYSLAL